MNKRLFLSVMLVMLIMALVFGMAVIGCDNDNNGSDNGKNGSGDNNNSSNTDNGTGCRTLSAGTKCSANSICSNNFLCLTGQGSDDNCTTSCSCQ